MIYHSCLVPSAAKASFNPTDYQNQQYPPLCQPQNEDQ